MNPFIHDISRIALAAPDARYARIDIIVLRESLAYPVVITGTPSPNPEEPALPSDVTTVLAKITVRPEGGGSTMAAPSSDRRPAKGWDARCGGRPMSRRR